MKIRKIYKTVFLTLILYAFFAIPMQSQVTIGLESIPLQGVLLDLKESDETNGNSNSDNGLVLPRVILSDLNSLSPMLTGSELSDGALKLKHTGLVVYNVNTSAPFEKGLYVWDGAKWNLLKANPSVNVTADNGLNLSGGSTVKLGGNLLQNTKINLFDTGLNNYNLIFNNVASGKNGKIGIGTSDPKATMQIENPYSVEPLVLSNLKGYKDAKNDIDAANPAYYDLRVSENGVVRKARSLGVAANQSFAYNLRANTLIALGYDTSGGGSDLKWTRNGADVDYIELPEDGVYIFSICLFGNISGPMAKSVDTNSYYISAFRGIPDVYSATNLIDIVEIVVMRTQNNNFASYSVNIPVSGYAGQKIYFKLSSSSAGNSRFSWTLTTGNDNVPNKTSLIFWKM